MPFQVQNNIILKLFHYSPPSQKPVLPSVALKSFMAILFLLYKTFLYEKEYRSPRSTYRDDDRLEFPGQIHPNNLIIKPNALTQRLNSLQ
jgi:hypothetical protein